MTNHHSLVPFKYVEFYDVPRLILLRHRSHLFLLASYFDQDKDDYDEHYSISILPSWVEKRIAASSWRVLGDDIGARLVGQMPVKDVVFDQTKRIALNPKFLDRHLK